MSFKEIHIEDLNMNPFTKIANEWALLTAGTREKGFNTMTASWAGFGRFWEKNAVTVYIRESRYTRRFFEENAYFTVSFYEEAYRKALDLCGCLHGNECDKVKQARLTPYFMEHATVFAEASLVFLCNKLLHADVTQSGADNTAVFQSVYPDGDLHRIFIGEVTRVFAKA